MVLKKPNELRDTSKPNHLIFKNSSGELLDLNSRNYTVSLLNDIIEHVGMSNVELLKVYHFAYLIYRTLSQYQHFSLEVSVDILNRDSNFEVSLIKQAVGTIYGLLSNELHFLGATDEQSKRMQITFDAYMFRK